MIGVLADEKDLPSVREFFELFKTPWEPYSRGRHYGVVLASSLSLGMSPPNADLTVVYGLEPPDRADRTNKHNGEVLVRYRDQLFPLFCGCSIFSQKGRPIITCEGTGKVVGLETVGSTGKIVRLGYDLFAELRFLLTSGQPAEFALIPSLDIHISILRDSIVSSGIPLVEIPPTPAGCDLILCLTHDVDFVSIRRHGLDRTVLGFLYRATIVSMFHCLTGRLSFWRLVRNLLAALSLPLIHLGFAIDFFNQFAQYLRLEAGRRSTYFLVPYKHQDGQSAPDRPSKGRATCYDVGDIQKEVANLLANNCEVGLHGVDAWHDFDKAVEEREQIRRVARTDPAGVRMHWLFFSNATPAILEKSGFLYDSTYGYNDAIGFRAGTAQPYRPFGAENLLELPLHVQDTALFTSGRLGMTQRQGIEAIDRIVQTIRRNGGVLTVNWHMRSIGPERQWDEPYKHLLRLGEGARVWVAPACEVSRWFSARRSARFDNIDGEAAETGVPATSTGTLPCLCLRWYNRPSNPATGAAEIPWTGRRAPAI